MATDATGTPTSPDSIPKYNTSVDAPSGLGFNAAMDAIQTALTNSYARKPSGLASGEVPVWNGSAWVRSSTTNIGPSSLGSSPSAGKVLTGDGNWTTTTMGSWSPAWTSSGSAPSLGNGTLEGHYVQIGKLVFGNLRWVAGSTTSFGTGLWYFSMPVVTMAASMVNRVIGNGFTYDNSGSLSRAMTAVYDTNSRVVMHVSSADRITNAAPWTYAQSDQISFNFFYETS